MLYALGNFAPDSVGANHVKLDRSHAVESTLVWDLTFVCHIFQ